MALSRRWNDSAWYFDSIHTSAMTTHSLLRPKDFRHQPRAATPYADLVESSLSIASTLSLRVVNMYQRHPQLARVFHFVPGLPVLSLPSYLQSRWASVPKVSFRPIARLNDHRDCTYPSLDGVDTCRALLTRSAASLSYPHHISVTPVPEVQRDGLLTFLSYECSMRRVRQFEIPNGCFSKTVHPVGSHVKQAPICYRNTKLCQILPMYVAGLIDRRMNTRIVCNVVRLGLTIYESPEDTHLFTRLGWTGRHHAASSCCPKGEHGLHTRCCSQAENLSEEESPFSR